ncbi:MAG: GntG family PLP-dependent aldolase [Spirochaetales bacterium]|nr:GntG family PLP-dependent aldolase [Spirochaetales bacterium]
MERLIDLRSDTITKPSREMREAMINTPVGDDVLGEDPTINKLEALAAEITGKEAALFVPSGTFANQLAILTHIGPGGEVYLDDNSHVIQHECGAASLLSGAFLRTITPQSNCLTWEEIEPKIRKVTDIHFPVPSLIEIENPLSNGSIIPLAEMEKIKAGAAKYNIPVHLDGARIFNAALALNTTVKKMASYTDSLMFCLSKGLTAPVGSLLCGTKDFIRKARRNRKLMGGGMRQAGILGAAGIFALENMVDRLEEDHNNARILGEALNGYDGFHVALDQISINMVFMQIDNLDDREKELAFLEILKSYKILTYPPEEGWFRFVTNNEVSNEDINYFLKSLPLIHEDYKRLIES